MLSDIPLAWARSDQVIHVHKICVWRTTDTEMQSPKLNIWRRIQIRLGAQNLDSSLIWKVWTITELLTLSGDVDANFSTLCSASLKIHINRWNVKMYVVATACWKKETNHAFLLSSDVGWSTSLCACSSFGSTQFHWFDEERQATMQNSWILMVLRLRDDLNVHPQNLMKSSLNKLGA
jgi:hypothetical protein